MIFFQNLIRKTARKNINSYFGEFLYLTWKTFQTNRHKNHPKIFITQDKIIIE